MVIHEDSNYKSIDSYFTFNLTACTVGGNNAFPGTMIDWVDFIVLGDIHYIGVYNGEGNKLREDNIEGVVGKVKFNVSDNITQTGYKVKDGDAAYLPEGTKIHKIKGYKPEFRIAVTIEGEWRTYEADTNPGAKKGEDLLDISERVSYIGINSETDGRTELDAIKGKADVDKLVDMVLKAEVYQGSQAHEGQRYFIAFHLLDGTSVTRSYWIDSGELSRGIFLPDEFGIEIRKALSEKD